MRKGRREKRALCLLFLLATAQTVSSVIPPGDDPSSCSNEDLVRGDNGEDCGCGNVGARSAQGAEKDAQSATAATKRKSYPGADVDMVPLEGGRFRMGTDLPMLPLDGEAPERTVTIRPFEIDRFAVTNADFAAFVADTGFKTESEQYGWSFVFQLMLTQEQQDNITQEVAGYPWWLPVDGASWRHPEGPGSDSLKDGRANHPATHVSWNDATAYCSWREARLPTEAEWEFAAQGGVPGRLFPWGGTLLPGGIHRANIWQGKFPEINTAEDGWMFTAPVDAFGPQNNYGVHNMVGNVWEWVQDWWTTDFSDLPYDNPTGPPTGTEKVKKGGSFLCHKSHCYRYRVAARTKTDAASGTSNQGFRCARAGFTTSRAAAMPDEELDEL